MRSVQVTATVVYLNKPKNHAQNNKTIVTAAHHTPSCPHWFAGCAQTTPLLVTHRQSLAICGSPIWERCPCYSPRCVHLGGSQQSPAHSLADCHHVVSSGCSVLRMCAVYGQRCHRHAHTWVFCGTAAALATGGVGWGGVGWGGVHIYINWLRVHCDFINERRYTLNPTSHPLSQPCTPRHTSAHVHCMPTTTTTPTPASYLGDVWECCVCVEITHHTFLHGLPLTPHFHA